ncbi:MAG: FtsX-like permease family protein, partial [Nitrososphaerales archaeon]
INTVLSGFTLFFSAIGGVSILVGGVGIVTTLYTSVMERTREIGTLKAIGAKGRTILFLFITESFIIGVLGSTTGLLVGGLLASVLLPIIGGFGGGGGNVPQITPVFVPETTVTIFLVGVLVSTIAGLYPAWRAARLLPIEALRKE